MPSQTFTASASTDTPSSVAWKRLDLSETWEAITGVDEVFDEVRGPIGQLQGFKFHSSLGGQRYVGSATPNGRVEGKSLSWDIHTPEIQGSITVALGDENALSTRVEVTMRVESVSLMAGMVFPLIAAAIGNGFQDTVQDFAASLEGS